VVCVETGVERAAAEKVAVYLKQKALNRHVAEIHEYVPASCNHSVEVHGTAKSGRMSCQELPESIMPVE